MKQRNHAFDILCGICIIRMVTLHIMSFCGEDKQDWWLMVMQWSFFFMSFFFFKAGYFNKGTNAGSDLGYLRDRSRRLLIPYLASGIIGAVVSFLLLILQGDLWPWQLLMLAVITVITLIIPGHLSRHYAKKEYMF